MLVLVIVFLGETVFNGVDNEAHHGLRNCVLELLIIFLVFVPVLLPISFLKMMLPTYHVIDWGESASLTGMIMIEALEAT